MTPAPASNFEFAFANDAVGGAYLASLTWRSGSKTLPVVLDDGKQGNISRGAGVDRSLTLVSFHPTGCGLSVLCVHRLWLGCVMRSQAVGWVCYAVNAGSLVIPPLRLCGLLFCADRTALDNC